MADRVAYDPRFLAGVNYFNECDFFEAHEVWEGLWAETEGDGRRFFQGLIQVAVCLHHFGNGNIRGAKKLYFGSRGYLEAYRPHYYGVDVQGLLDQLQTCCAEILASREEFPKIDIVASLIPEIHLTPLPA